jgi:hypothetical protein
MILSALSQARTVLILGFPSKGRQHILYKYIVFFHTQAIWDITVILSYDPTSSLATFVSLYTLPHLRLGYGSDTTNNDKKKRFVMGSPCSVLLSFSQSYVEYDLRKNKIVVPFFCQPINFYKLIIRL